MSDELSMSERMEAVARRMRGPLVRNFGIMTEEGRRGAIELDALMRELPSVPAETAADALALAAMIEEVAYIMAQNCEGNAMAIEAAHVLGDAIRSLKACLAELSGRPASDFAVSTRCDALSVH